MFTGTYTGAQSLDFPAPKQETSGRFTDVSPFQGGEDDERDTPSGATGNNQCLQHPQIGKCIVIQ